MPKISCCYIVYNRAETLKYSLASIYDFVDEIVIIDGSPKGPSEDDTGNIIASFPQEKIYYEAGVYKNEEEQRNRYLKYATGEWLFVVDGDEVYKESDLERMEHLLKVYPKAMGFRYSHLYYKCTPNNISAEGREDEVKTRMYRHLPGCHYRVNYGLSDNKGRLIDNHYKVVYDPVIKCYHYNNVQSLKRAWDNMKNAEQIECN